MKSNKYRDTKPELKLRAALRAAGASGYRLHWRVAGKPDVAFPGLKIAVFVNGCFWHHCPVCCRAFPKSNNVYWVTKIERNMARDIENGDRLAKLGWSVVTVWECEIKRDVAKVASEIAALVAARRAG